ncbi:alpha/beta fold hydrolase [Arthrobacter sp. LjRoot14]|uniref:alpha/beta fold hydrolase n=1 Tax=Arthrobacter sp. LjRoot14 TaxID=3342265 RepID=UPI003ECCC01C
MEGLDGVVAGIAMPHLAGVTHRWIDVRGLRMHIAEAGQGQPLLLLHGFPQNWWEWHGVIPRLAEHYRVIAVDQRGFGWTGAPAKGYDARTLVDDIIHLMATLDITRARLLTHDWGAIIGQQLAMDRPDLVEALVVTGTPDVHIRPNARLLGLFPKLWHAFAIAAPGIGPRVQQNEKVVRHLFTAFEPAGGVKEEDIQLYYAAMAQRERALAGSAVYRATILPAFMGIIFGAYARRDFAVRTLVLTGAMEPSGTLQGMGHRPGRGGNVTTEILPGEGHFLADHRPELLADRALRFFAQEPDH